MLSRAYLMGQSARLVQGNRSWCDFVWRSSYTRYFRVVVPSSNDIADALSEHRTGQGRSVRDGSFCGIGFVLTDDSKGLLTAIVADNRHGCAKANFRNVDRRWKDLRARAAGAPVPNLASRSRD